MNHWLERADELEPGAMLDPLCVERSAPLDDHEAAMIEALCHAATPGPLVIDATGDGERAVVVSLPDGRLVLSLAASVEQTKDESVRHANAQLVCKARYFLLRLLRDRQQWQRQLDRLQQRIRSLEEVSRREAATTAAPGPGLRAPLSRGVRGRSLPVRRPR